jgi:hypothetical protein
MRNYTLRLAFSVTSSDSSSKNPSSIAALLPAGVCVIQLYLQMLCCNAVLPAVPVGSSRLSAPIVISAPQSRNWRRSTSASFGNCQRPFATSLGCASIPVLLPCPAARVRRRQWKPLPYILAFCCIYCCTARAYRLDYRNGHSVKRRRRDLAKTRGFPDFDPGSPVKCFAYTFAPKDLSPLVPGPICPAVSPSGAVRRVGSPPIR